MNMTFEEFKGMKELEYMSSNVNHNVLSKGRFIIILSMLLITYLVFAGSMYTTIENYNPISDVSKKQMNGEGIQEGVSFNSKVTVNVERGGIIPMYNGKLGYLLPFHLGFLFISCLLSYKLSKKNKGR